MGNSAIPTRLQAKWNAYYALWIYLPYSLLARSWRTRSRVLRRVKNPHQQEIRLPQSSWRTFFPSKPIRLVEIKKRKGNIRLSELALLAKAAAAVPPSQEIIEIGTFDGRTTLNLAVNSAPDVRIVTLDLPKDYVPKFPMNIGEYKLANKPVSGARYRNCNAAWSDDASRIVQLLGDSATFDWSPFHNKAGLVFVDGSHTYENVRNDSDVAFRLLAPGGTVIWHDYGVWEEVTRALDEIETTRALGLRHIRGTSLVFWRKANAKGTASRSGSRAD
jgi:predicted O-methyltransferase YrrM